MHQKAFGSRAPSEPPPSGTAGGVYDAPSGPLVRKGGEGRGRIGKGKGRGGRGGRERELFIYVRCQKHEQN